MLCYAMLCYAMLCYAMLCCAMLSCYAVLCYAMLCYAVLCYALLCCAMLRCAMPRCAMPSLHASRAEQLDQCPRQWYAKVSSSQSRARHSTAEESRAEQSTQILRSTPAPVADFSDFLCEGSRREDSHWEPASAGEVIC